MQKFDSAAVAEFIKRGRTAQAAVDSIIEDTPVQPPAELPPLGPTSNGRGASRGKMYAHNRKVAAHQRELREQVDAGILPASALAELLPPGPTGKGFKSQRAKMHAHNRKLAARRQKAAEDGPRKT